MVRASIVVVSSVNAAGLDRCLRSIDRLDPDEVSFETIVILNGARDDVRAIAHGWGDGITVVESLVNRGLAGGCNLGRTLARGEFVVLLHDDAEAQAGWLSELVRCADEHPEAGAVGSRVLYPDGRLQLAGADARARGDVGRRRRHGRALVPGLLRRRRPRPGDPDTRPGRPLRAALADPARLVDQLVHEVATLHDTIAAKDATLVEAYARLDRTTPG